MKGGIKLRRSRNRVWNVMIGVWINDSNEAVLTSCSRGIVVLCLRTLLLVHSLDISVELEVNHGKGIVE